MCVETTKSACADVIDLQCMLSVIFFFSSENVREVTEQKKLDDLIKVVRGHLGSCLVSSEGLFY